MRYEKRDLSCTGKIRTILSEMGATPFSSLDRAIARRKVVRFLCATKRVEGRTSAR